MLVLFRRSVAVLLALVLIGAGACTTHGSPSRLSSTVSGPLVLGSVPRLRITHTSPSFKPTLSGFETIHARYAAYVGNGRSLAFQTGPGVHPVNLTTTSVAGVAEQATPPRMEAGAVVVDHGTVRERFQATGQGVEQSYEFDAPPPGASGVHVELRIEGAWYAGSDTSGLLFRSVDAGFLRYGTATWVDARGARTPARVTFADGTVRLDVDAEVVKRSVFPAVLDPTVNTAEAIGATQAYASLTPALASNGTKILVVWAAYTDDTSESGTLYGAIVTVSSGSDPEPALANLGAAPNPFTIATGTSGSLSYIFNGFAVASDGTDFFVAYCKYNGTATGADILGARVTAAGIVDATALTIANSSGNEFLPTVLFDGSEYFVNWIDQDGSVGVPYARVTTGAPSVFAADGPTTTGVTLPASAASFGGAQGLASAGAGTILLASAKIGPAPTYASTLFVSVLSSLSSHTAAPAVTTTTTPAMSIAGSALDYGGISGITSLTWDGGQYIALGGADDAGAILTLTSSGSPTADNVLPGFGSVGPGGYCGSMSSYPFAVVGLGDPGVDLYFGYNDDGDSGSVSNFVGGLVRSGDGSIDGTLFNLPGNAYSSNQGEGGLGALPLGSGNTFVAYTTCATYSGGNCTGPFQVEAAVVTVATGGKTGSSCGSASSCLSGACVDGYCCNATCTATCQTCSATPGECTPLAVGSNPTGCSLPENACDGAGNCKLVNGQPCLGDGYSCVSGQCTDGYCCNSACTGSCNFCDLSGTLGTCTLAPAGTEGVPACTDLLCDGTSANCPSGCSGDIDCPAGTYCSSGGACVTQVATGQGCNLTTDCKTPDCRVCESGFCVDDVCCSTACDETCQTCAPSTGVCSTAPSGSPGSPLCAPYTCNGTSPECTTSCTSDAQCSTHAFCDISKGTCVGTAANGAVCAHGDACASGFCVDGVCCNTACGDQCQACDVTTSVGTCSPVDGKPHGSRPACNGSDAGGDAGASCNVRVCQGETSVTSCVGFVGSSVECRAPSCANGTETTAASCDGTGTCPAVSTHKCAPYVCGETACKTTCASDADCATGNICETSTGTCSAGSTCISDTTVQSSAGVKTACAPYVCSGSACLTNCSTSAECSSGSACDATGHCVEASSAVGASSSGACAMSRAAPRRSPSWSIFALVGALSIVRRMRHKRRGSPSNSAGPLAIGLGALVSACGSGTPSATGGSEPDASRDVSTDETENDGARTKDGDVGDRTVSPDAPACAPLCPHGAACGADGDCASDLCTAGACAYPACAPSCLDGDSCGGPLDCASQVCTLGKCASPSCAPTCAEGSSCGGDKDCVTARCLGGSCVPPACAPSCPEGNGCGAATECASGICMAGACLAPLCSPDCPNGDACGGDGDCGSQSCVEARCVAPACSPTCPDDNPCGAAGDCATSICSAGKCLPPACSPMCPDTNICGAAADCASGVCTKNACASPACAPSCLEGAPCGGGTDCLSGTCTDGKCVPPLCAPTCGGGVACYEGTDCDSGVCTGNRCVDPVSCAAVLKANPAATSGVYNIQPVGSPSFNAYCDMSDSGGGWTLALKVPGDTTTFDLSYDSSYWTSPPITHGKPTLTQNAAMYPAYEEVPFTEIMITMAAVSASAPSTLLVLPVSDSTSLRDLIASSAPNTVTTSLPRTSWTALTTPTATVQTQCGAQGINLTTTSTTFTAQQYARVRIGFLASRTAGCATPDSYIGIGGEAGTSDTSCDPSTPYSGPTAGSAGAVNCSGGADVTDFGFVWVR